jgi:uncharacterized membrane protein
MPYEWTAVPTEYTPDTSPGNTPDTPQAQLHLWPYRSLPNRGFVVFIGLTAMMFAFPLIQVLGTPILWGILPFILIVVAALWYSLRRNHADGTVIEELRLWPDRVTLTRTGPRRAHHFWEANPHWVSVTLYPTGGPVENYLTLKGAGREVEIGSFLSEEERVALRQELQTALSDLR